MQTHFRTGRNCNCKFNTCYKHINFVNVLCMFNAICIKIRSTDARHLWSHACYTKHQPKRLSLFWRIFLVVLSNWTMCSMGTKKAPLFSSIGPIHIEKCYGNCCLCYCCCFVCIQVVIKLTIIVIMVKFAWKNLFSRGSFTFPWSGFPWNFQFCEFFAYFKAYITVYHTF